MIQKFIEDQGITFPVLHDNASVYGRFGLPGAASPYPRDFIIDADGVVRLAKHEYDPGTMINVIETLLKATTSFEENSPHTPDQSMLISVFPNPFNPDFNLELTLNEPSELTGRLYNTNGQEVKRVFTRRPFLPGEHRLTISAEGLSSGLYLLRIESKESQVIKKVLKVQ